MEMVIEGEKMAIWNKSQEQKLREQIAKKYDLDPSEVNINTFEGTAIIEEGVLDRRECEQLLKGTHVEGVGCVVEEHEQPDGSTLYGNPSLKVVRKTKEQREKEDSIVEETPEFDY